jgi:hypothetical protein
VSVLNAPDHLRPACIPHPSVIHDNVIIFIIYYNHTIRIIAA